MCIETCHSSCPHNLSQTGPVSARDAGRTHLGGISSQPLPSCDLPSLPLAMGCLPSMSFLKPFSGCLRFILRMLLWLTVIIPELRFENKKCIWEKVKYHPPILCSPLPGYKQAHALLSLDINTAHTSIPLFCGQRSDQFFQHPVLKRTA